MNTIFSLMLICTTQDYCLYNGNTIYGSKEKIKAGHYIVGTEKPIVECIASAQDSGHSIFLNYKEPKKIEVKTCKDKLKSNGDCLTWKDSPFILICITK